MANTVKELDKILQQEDVSPYELHKIVNAKLEQKGSEKRVRPQMVYNYAKNGLIDGVKYVSTTGVRFPMETALAWAEKYSTKHSPKVEAVESDEVEGQLDLLEIEA